MKTLAELKPRIEMFEEKYGYTHGHTMFIVGCLRSEHFVKVLRSALANGTIKHSLIVKDTNTTLDGGNITVDKGVSIAEVLLKKYSVENLLKQAGAQ